MRTLGWKLSLVLSVIVHVALLAALGWYVLGGREILSKRSSQARGGATVATEDSGQVDPANLMELREGRTAALSDDEKAQELERLVGDDLPSVRFSSARSIVPIIERVRGVDRGRKYAPDPTAKGAFDSNTATLYDMRQTTRNGRTVYVQTLVDAQGRTLTAETPAGQMSEADLRAYRVFLMAQRNPKLRFLLDSALRIGETMVQKQAKEK